MIWRARGSGNAAEGTSRDDVWAERVHGTLSEILTELRQLRAQSARRIEPKWLTISDAAAYTGMSVKWVRSLEPVAPRGLFRRVKGTVFVSKTVLDDLFEGRVELEEA
jgi:hypothetical protein